MEGWDIADGIATRCGLNGRGIASRWGQIFCPRPDMPRGPPFLLCDGIYQTQSGPSHMENAMALEKFTFIGMLRCSFTSRCSTIVVC